MIEKRPRSVVRDSLFVNNPFGNISWSYHECRFLQRILDASIKYSLRTMLPATLDEYQTSFQLENAIHFSSQNDQPPMKTLVLESLEAGLRKWSNHGTKTSCLSLQTSRPPVLTPKVIAFNLLALMTLGGTRFRVQHQNKTQPTTVGAFKMRGIN